MEPREGMWFSDPLFSKSFSSDVNVPFPPSLPSAFHVASYASAQMTIKCPLKERNVCKRNSCEGSNDDQMSFKETKFMR